MALKIAGRAGIAPFIAMDVMRAAHERAAAGHDVLHLEIGQPGLPVPEAVRRAAQAAVADDLLGYTDALGLPVLRERIARWYAEQHGLQIDPGRIAVTVGASGAFLLAFLAAFEAGDRVALAEPGYPAYRNILSSLGLRVVALPAEEEDGYQPTIPLLDRHGQADVDGLIIASPANPTGAVITPEALGALVHGCEARGIRLIADEIYHGITYDRPAATVLSTTDDAIVVNSFSKYFGMTGWRLGWLVLPPDLVRPVERLAQSLFISPPTLSQRAALAAFDCREELDTRVADYAESRRLLLQELPSAGFDRLARADGAFYLYADVSRLTNDSLSFCRRILDETGVALTPGLDFDRERGQATLRLSFAGSRDTIARAIERLQKWRGA